MNGKSPPKSHIIFKPLKDTTIAILKNIIPVISTGGRNLKIGMK